MMEEEFRDLLQGDVAVSDMATQINFGQHPQGQPLPAIIMNNVGMQHDVTLDGPHSLTTSRVQVDCYADTYGAAKLLSRAVVTRMHGYRGGNFQGVMAIDASDNRTGQTDGASAAQPFRVSIDFRVFYNQP